MTDQAPRTISGQAWVSGTRPHIRRALAATILAIEGEAIAPYVEALREADRVLGALAAKDAPTAWDGPAAVELIKQADVAHRLVQPLLAKGPGEHR